MFRKYLKALSAASLLLLTIHIAAAQTTQAANQPSPAAVEANKLFQNQKWDEAVVAFGALTKAEPANGMAWYRYGASLSNLNRHQDALVPLQKITPVMVEKPGPTSGMLSTFARRQVRRLTDEQLHLRDAVDICGALSCCRSN